MLAVVVVVVRLVGQVVLRVHGLHRGVAHDGDGQQTPHGVHRAVVQHRRRVCRARWSNREHVTDGNRFGFN